jgi:hypothetical protein
VSVLVNPTPRQRAIRWLEPRGLLQHGREDRAQDESYIRTLAAEIEAAERAQVRDTITELHKAFRRLARSVRGKGRRHAPKRKL